MTTLTIDGIASWNEPGHGDETLRSVARRRGGFDRRTFVRGVVTVGAGLGLGVIGQLPVAREAKAACVEALRKDIRSGCPSGYDEGCDACGPSRVYSDVCRSDGYHKYSGDYRNRPNDCAADFYDGWTWNQGGCGCGTGCVRTYRCHDGCKRVNGSFVNSICSEPIGLCAC